MAWKFIDFFGSVPEGTKFENIRASLKGRTLNISFPTSPKAPAVVTKKEGET
jgi:hypothetical protein